MRSASTLSADAALQPAQAVAWPLGAAGRLAFALVLGVAALWPAGYLLAQALPDLLHGGWLAHFATTTLPDQARLSAWVAVESTIVAIAVGALPAVMVSRFDFRGRGLVTVLALLPLLFAPFVTAGLWTVAFSWSFLESRHALALQHGLTCSAYVFVVFRVAAMRIPTAFGELAAVLGLGPLQRLWRVHLPAYSVPAAASLMIVFAQAVGDYAAADRLGLDTLSVGMHNLWLASQSSQVAAIVSVVLIVPSVLLVAVAAWAGTRLLSRNPLAPAAAAAQRRPLRGPWAWAVVGWSLIWSLPGFWIPEFLSVRWAWKRWGRTRFEDIPVDLLQAMVTSASTALLVGALCVALVVVLRSGQRSVLAERMPWFFLANYFLPSLVLALAFVMMSADGTRLAGWLGDARDSRLLVVLTEALRFAPLALLPVLDALRRTPQAMIDTARVFGAGPWQARRVAFAGHVVPALVLGCGLVFMESVKELDLSLTLQPFGYSSPALKIYAFSRHQNMDRAAVWVLISQLLMLAPLALLWWRLRGASNAPARAHA